MELSIVSTLYNSASYVDDFYQRISAQAQSLCVDYEIVFVDDGSPDTSLQIAVALSESDDRVKVIELSRNHGHHRAMMIGLDHSSGDLVFLTDVDLEEVPENLIIRMSSHMIDQGPVSFWPWTSTVGSETRTCPAPDQGGKCGSCRTCWNREIPNIEYGKH